MIDNFKNLLTIIGANYLIFLIVLSAIIYFFRQDSTTKKQLAIFSLITLPMIYLIAQMARLFYFNPRPFVVGNFIPLIPHAPDNGFPSDHVLLSSSLAILIFYYNRRFGIILWISAVLVGISRVLAGVHHPIDVIGGLIIPIIVSFPIHNSILPYLTNKLTRGKQGLQSRSSNSSNKN